MATTRYVWMVSVSLTASVRRRHAVTPSGFQELSLTGTPESVSSRSSAGTQADPSPIWARSSGVVGMGESSHKSLSTALELRSAATYDLAGRVAVLNRVAATKFRDRGTRPWNAALGTALDCPPPTDYGAASYAFRTVALIRPRSLT